MFLFVAFKSSKINGLSVKSFPHFSPLFPQKQEGKFFVFPTFFPICISKNKEKPMQVSTKQEIEKCHKALKIKQTLDFWA